MHCSTCGKQTPENSKFCLHCGTPVAATITAEKSVPAAEGCEDGEATRYDEYEESGEREPTHWKLMLSTILCAIIGVVLLATPETVTVIIGITLLGFSVAGAIVSEFWTTVDALPTGKKVVVWIPVVSGGLLVFLLFALFGIAGEATKSTGRDFSRSAALRAEFRSDIERGVKKGLKRG